MINTGLWSKERNVCGSGLSRQILTRNRLPSAELQDLLLQILSLLSHGWKRSSCSWWETPRAKSKTPLGSDYSPPQSGDPHSPSAVTHALPSPLNLDFTSLQTSVASLFFTCLIFNRHV